MKPRAREPLPRLEVEDAAAWRRWIECHHGDSCGVWLVFHKPAGRLTYQAALDEALCFGWIDSIIRREDDETYVRKFTPRTDSRRWSEANKTHARRLVAEGRMTEAGRRVIGVDLASAGSGFRSDTTPSRGVKSPASADAPVPRFVAAALARRPRAAAFFAGLAPGYRRRYLGWILAAKQEATRKRRLAELLDLLDRGVKAVMK